MNRLPLLVAPLLAALAAVPAPAPAVGPPPPKVTRLTHP
jgi:hypothetical protein